MQASSKTATNLLGYALVPDLAFLLNGDTPPGVEPPPPGVAIPSAS